MASVEVPNKRTSREGNERITVVIPMDGTEFSDYALKFYAECLHKPSNRVMIVHNTDDTVVTHPAVKVEVKDGDSESVKEFKRRESSTTGLIKKIKEGLKEFEIDGEIVRIHGETGPSLIGYINDTRPNYVVIGCRGIGEYRKAFTESITDYITHHCNIPVMIARNTDHIEKLQNQMHLNHGDIDVGPPSTESPDLHKIPNTQRRLSLNVQGFFKSPNPKDS